MKLLKLKIYLSLFYLAVSVGVFNFVCQSGIFIHNLSINRECQEMFSAPLPAFDQTVPFDKYGGSEIVVEKKCVGEKAANTRLWGDRDHKNEPVSAFIIFSLLGFSPLFLGFGVKKWFAWKPKLDQ